MLQIEKTNELLTHFNDKAWPYMWFLNKGGKESKGFDMNVDKAWAQGVSGKDLIKNYFLNHLVNGRLKP